MPLFLSLARAGSALRRRPGPSRAAMLPLALGMAVCIAVFTLAEAVLFRKLPYPDADRIVALNARVDQKPSTGISWQDARDLRTQGRSFMAAAVFKKRTWGLTDSTDN